MKPVVEQIFHAVADLSPEARTQYFSRHNVDQSTRHEVETLLAFDSCATESLERDIGVAAARAVAHVEPSPAGARATAAYPASRVDGEMWFRVAVKLLR